MCKSGKHWTQGLYKYENTKSNGPEGVDLEVVEKVNVIKIHDTGFLRNW